ncbi:unnamed protein product, partial [marine sediment metagenome]
TIQNKKDKLRVGADLVSAHNKMQDKLVVSE